jgi:diguanylate cyclase (GGDEF)-like protein/PAS domain S-box-containing protein
MSLRLLAAAAWVLVALLPLRAEPVNVAFEGAYVDLLPLVEKVQEFSPQATITLPAAGSTPRQTIALEGRGPGPLYRWAVFTLHNPEPQPRELVIAAPHQRFVGSQVLRPLPEGSRVIGLATADGRQIPPMASLGIDTYALTIPPEHTVSLVLEVSATGLDSLSLWNRAAFHMVADRYAFFRGLLLGISMLLGIGFICLFIVRPRSVFPAAALFGWSAIAFLVIETGYLPTVLGKFPSFADSGQMVRALTEGLMLAGVIAMLVSFVELRRWMPRIAMALMASGVIAALSALYGLFDPRTAIGLVRIAFAVAVVVGLGIILVLWRRGAVRAQVSLLGWVVLTGWTVAAGVGALGLADPVLMHPLISAGLVLVLVTIGFTLGQLAFDLGMASSAAFEEAGRRALALAASDQAVWDWQVDHGRLYVGPEIERALGLEEGTCGNDAEGWLGLIHPADRAAYGAAIESAERRGRGSFTHEFRLRRADGSYRWYELRARAMPGAADGASRLIGTLADVTVLRRSEDRLLADAVRDRLTGLPNRALFLDRLEQAMGRARDWSGAEIYVIALELDRFKSFNDGLGVEAGDYLLTTTGRRLQACVGPAGTLGRLPGHQFGIIWSEGQQAAEFTAALSAAVAQPIQLPAGEVVLTASMGVARVHHDYRRAEAVLKDAEIALYEAKRQGYAAIEFFRPDMHDERSQLVQMEQNLRHALERDEIEVLYQPIMRLSDRKVAGFEALMRWRRGDLVLEPDSFVGLAEETGIIRELGSYVLKEAAGRLGIWQRAFRPQEPLFVAVNISSVQLLNWDLVEDVQRLMEREELLTGTLKLELTESLVVENPELAHKLLMRLKQMGVALACDDFGTGHSGLESVFRLPFDSVKIDRVFLEDESGERNWIIVESMLRLARDLGLGVVAEGIETEEQMERLSGLGCEYGQGFLIGQPVNAQQVVEALGGLSHGARGLTGLAAFWAGLTGGRQPEAEASPAHSRHRPDVDAAAPEPVEVREAESVLHARRIVPPAAKHVPSATPRVGSAPFAPRHVKMPEARLPEVEIEMPKPCRPEVALSQAWIVDAEPAPASEAPAIEPEKAEEIRISAAEPDVGDAAAGNGLAEPSEAKRARREKRKKAKEAQAADTRKLRRAKAKPIKSAAAKSAAAKSAPAKSSSAKSRPVKRGAKASSTKKSPARQR